MSTIIGAAGQESKHGVLERNDRMADLSADAFIPGAGAVLMSHSNIQQD
jgi:hypothetical protein